MAVSLKKERIDFRISPDQKSILEKAAQIRHVSLSAYVISSSINQARIDLEEIETLILSARDRDSILASLDNPPEPNEALKGLFR